MGVNKGLLLGLALWKRQKQGQLLEQKRQHRFWVHPIMQKRQPCGVHLKVEGTNSLPTISSPSSPHKYGHRYHILLRQGRVMWNEITRVPLYEQETRKYCMNRFWVQPNWTQIQICNPNISGLHLWFLGSASFWYLGPNTKDVCCAHHVRVYREERECFPQVDKPSRVLLVPITQNSMLWQSWQRSGHQSRICHNMYFHRSFICHHPML